MPLAAPRLDIPSPVTLADPAPAGLDLGAARDANALERDRAQALQLMDKVANGAYSTDELRRLQQLCDRLGKNCGLPPREHPNGAE